MGGSRKHHLILCLRIFCPNLIFLMSVCGVFQKNLIGSLGFELSLYCTCEFHSNVFLPVKYVFGKSDM